MFGMNHVVNSEDTGERFRGKGNVAIDSDDWEYLYEKYRLHEVPSLTGIMGIPFNINHVKIKYQRDADELEEKLKKQKFDDEELEKAYDEHWLNDRHRKILADNLAADMMYQQDSNYEHRRAKKMGFWEPRHELLLSTR
jgi:hypothetical protein